MFFLIIACLFSVITHSTYDFIPLETLMHRAIKQEIFPGGVLLIAHKGEIIYHKPFGKHTYDKDAQPITCDTLFDLASITKPVATATALMLLWDKKYISLEDSVARYLPLFATNNKDQICIKHLLMHNAGLSDEKNFSRISPYKNEVIHTVLTQKPITPIETAYSYSCAGFFILQMIIEQIAQMPLDIYCYEHIFKPLGMHNTYFNPPPHLHAQCAPTSAASHEGFIQGQVHDIKAYLLGGVCGNAGLFSTAYDLHLFMHMMRAGGKGLIHPQTIADWTRKQTLLENRSFGWATAPDCNLSCGNLISSDAYGHLGFTGTSIWFDRQRDAYVILLTNRTYPTMHHTRHIPFRTLLHDAIWEMIDAADSY